MPLEGGCIRQDKKKGSVEVKTWGGSKFMTYNKLKIYTHPQSV